MFIVPWRISSLIPIWLFTYAQVETLMNRIAHRDRSYERNMERAYIAELMEAYDKFLPRINGRTAS